MRAATFSTVTTSSRETLDLGQNLGEAFVGGEIIGIEGPLGSGKTCLVRGIAGGMGIPPEHVTSPTFVFLHYYKGRLPLFHWDLFRTETQDDIAQIGLLEEWDQQGVVVIEWAEKAGGFLPEERMTIQITNLREEKRQFTLSGRGGNYAALLESLIRRRS